MRLALFCIVFFCTASIAMDSDDELTVSLEQFQTENDSGVLNQKTCACCLDWEQSYQEMSLNYAAAAGQLATEHACKKKLEQTVQNQAYENRYLWGEVLRLKRLIELSTQVSALNSDISS